MGCTASIFTGQGTQGFEKDTNLIAKPSKVDVSTTGGQGSPISPSTPGTGGSRKPKASDMVSFKNPDMSKMFAADDRSVRRGNKSAVAISAGSQSRKVEQLTVEEQTIQAVKARLMKEWDPEYEPEDIRPPQDTPDVHSERATNVTLDMILRDDEQLARKTKIICTAGPACWSEDGFSKLLDAGCNVLRLNFSHGDHAGHGEVLERFRKVCAAKSCIAATLLDTKGPEIRTAMLRDGKDIELEAGQNIFVEAVGDRYTEFEGYKDAKETRIGLSYAKLCESMKTGSKILLADGSISIQVDQVIDGTTLQGTVLNSKKLGQRKNCNLPGVKVDIPVLTDKDINDLQNFAAKHQMDFVAASFVQSAADVQFIRRVLDEAGGQKIKIISKIENLEGLQRFDEILRESDGIMVARGDLGMEIPSEKVPLAQKMMITKANIAGKLIICATQMLESMVENPRPTRAEMTDVANAVYDGVDCVMLSGESANGKFSDTAVRTMAAIVANAEVGVDYYSQFNFIRYWATHGNERAMPPNESMLSSAASMAVNFTEDTTPEQLKKPTRSRPVPLIAVLTSKGIASGMVSKYRPPCPIIVASPDDQVLRQAGITFAQIPLKVSSMDISTTELANAAMEVYQAMASKHTEFKVIVLRGRSGPDADVDPVVTVVKAGETGGLKRKGWSTGNSLYSPSGVPIRRPGTRSLRSTLTNLPLITAPLKSARSSKIVCTMGPSCWSEADMSALLDAGMDIIRLNFSHGDHKGHLEVLQRFRKVCAQKAKEAESKGLESPPRWACLLDTKGPEIRTAMLRDGKDIELEADQDIIVEAVGDKYTEFEGYKDAATGETRIGLSYAKLCSSMSPGNKILLADGSLSIKVEEILTDTTLRGKVLNSKKLGQRKNCNLPGVKVDIPVLTDKDIKDLQNFCVAHSMDYVAASFVQSAADVQFIRRILDEAGGEGVKIISKIENAEGLINYDEILRESDGIMVARGDLGMEIPAEKVPLAQKMMITKANVAGKFVITATQMLESMISNPRPTRAEMTDVANAVLDGTDCVMLSGETANGSFPMDAVKTMAAICVNAEHMVEVDKRFRFLRNHTPKPMTGAEAVCSGAVQAAIDTDAKAIICITASGRAPGLVSKYRPAVPVIVVTPNEQLVRHCRSAFGQFGLIVEDKDYDFQELMDYIMKHLKAYNIVPNLESGDQLVLLQRRKAPPSTQLYDDQRLVMKTYVVNGVSQAADIKPTFYPGQKIIFHRSTKVGLDTILDQDKWKFIVRKTKIICTAGPACWSEQGLGQLLDAGCNILRLNFSHGDHEGHFEVLERFRKVTKAKSLHAACLLDTKGPEIRTAMLRDGKDIELQAGQSITIVAVGDEYDKWEGYTDAATGETKIGLSYEHLCRDVRAGQKILLADGSISIQVEKVVDDKTLLGKVLNSKKLGQRKNCNLPGVKVDIPVLTKKDINDLQNFCVKHQMDFVAASFVQSKQDVLFIRQILDEAGGKDVKIISKIENVEGLKNFDEILEVTDGVMVARGDLGMEIAVEKVPLAQKMLITKANIAGKFVICATQMMESMITSPVPTRAEMTDVANAVWDGVDAVMLSGESANGAYPEVAVSTMAQIARNAEIGVNFYQSFDYIRTFTPKPIGTVEAVCSAIAKNAVDVRPGMIMVFSENGKVARLLAKYRPCAPVLVVTSKREIARYCSALFGMYPLLLDKPISDSDQMPAAVTKALEFGVETGLCVAGKEVVVLTSRMVLQDSEASREVFVTIAPGQLSLDALGSMAYASSAADPRFVAKTISMRSTTIDLAMLMERAASSSGASSDPSMHGNSSSTRLTKLAFTVGPACEDPAVMEEFVRAGANLARFNVSHGSLEKHTAMLGQLREISSKHGARVAVMLELAGPQVRTSYLVKSRESKERVSKVEVKAGDDVELFGTDDTNPATFTGYKTDNKLRLGMSLPDLPEVVRVGTKIRLQDGALVLEVTAVRPGGPVQAKALNSAMLSERKRVHISGLTLHARAVTHADHRVIQEWGIPHKVDFICMSHVKSRQEVEELRNYLDDMGGDAIKIVAKVETEEALRCVDELLDVADALMLERGNLGAVVTPEKVALAQSVVLTKSNVAGKPAIISKQMLESMTSNPRPTRAEMTDVANAVLDSAACIMLCSETATGSFPADAVKTACKIVRNAQQAVNYAALHSFIRDFSAKPYTTHEAAAVAVARSCMDAKLGLAVVFSDSGDMASLVTKYRPQVPVLVVTSRENVAMQCELVFGQFAHVVSEDSMQAAPAAVDSALAQALVTATSLRLCSPGSKIVVVHGTSSLDVAPDSPSNSPVIKILEGML